MFHVYRSGEEDEGEEDEEPRGLIMKPDDGARRCRTGAQTCPPPPPDPPTLSSPRRRRPGSKLEAQIAFININVRQAEVVPFAIAHALWGAFVKSNPSTPVCLVHNAGEASAHDGCRAGLFLRT